MTLSVADEKMLAEYDRKIERINAFHKALYDIWESSDRRNVSNAERVRINRFLSACGFTVDELESWMTDDSVDVIEVVETLVTIEALADEMFKKDMNYEWMFNVAELIKNRRMFAILRYPNLFPTQGSQLDALFLSAMVVRFFTINGEHADTDWQDLAYVIDAYGAREVRKLIVRGHDFEMLLDAAIAGVDLNLLLSVSRATAV